MIIREIATVCFSPSVVSYIVLLLYTSETQVHDVHGIIAMSSTSSFNENGDFGRRPKGAVIFTGNYKLLSCTITVVAFLQIPQTLNNCTVGG